MRLAKSCSGLFAVLPIELLSKIFEKSDQKDCAAAAIVCRQWSNAALDELWRSLPSLMPLLNLLGPIENTNMGKVHVILGAW